MTMQREAIKRWKERVAPKWFQLRGSDSFAWDETHVMEVAGGVLVRTTIERDAVDAGNVPAVAVSTVYVPGASLESFRPFVDDTAGGEPI